MSSSRSRKQSKNRRYHRAQVTITVGSHWRFRKSTVGKMSWRHPTRSAVATLPAVIIVQHASRRCRLSNTPVIPNWYPVAHSGQKHNNRRAAHGSVPARKVERLLVFVFSLHAKRGDGIAPLVARKQRRDALRGDIGPARRIER